MRAYFLFVSTAFYRHAGFELIALWLSWPDARTLSSLLSILVQLPMHHMHIKIYLYEYLHFSDSSMLGERDRIRNAVGWELDETATSSNNNGVQQSGWVSGIGSVGNVFEQ